jgi:hypothetical protein
MTVVRHVRLPGLFSGIILLLAAVLSACSGPGRKVASLDLPLARKGVCRIGPDGGPPRFNVSSRQAADRGIGGTGGIAASQPGVISADRGIGGTGIVGVVTGFASICVDGIEVPYNASAAVDIEGTAADVSDLRAGDVVAIRVVGSPRATEDLPKGVPQVLSISVRQEAAGRIERTKGEWRVAGQRILIAPNVPGAGRFRLGDWVSVSGLRRPDGVIVASRLDKAMTHAMSARGVVQLAGGIPHLGMLKLPAGSAKEGDWVHAVGTYTGNRPQARSVSDDDLCPNPDRCFAGSVDHLVVQGFVRVADHAMWVNGLPVPAHADVEQNDVNGVRIIVLERQPDGHYAAVDLRMPDPVRPNGIRRPLPLPPDVPVPAVEPATQPDTNEEPAGTVDDDRSAVPLANSDFQAGPPSWTAVSRTSGNDADAISNGRQALRPRPVGFAASAPLARPVAMATASSVSSVAVGPMQEQ